MQTSLSIALCVSLLLVGCGARRREGYDAAVRLGGEWLNCDRLSNAGCAVALMRVPSQAEARRMRHLTRLLRERFGGVSAVKAPTTDARMAELVVASSGDDHSPSATATFPVKFAKLSNGYIQIDACRTDAKWEISAVHYGLPLSNPSSVPMIDSIHSDL